MTAGNRARVHALVTALQEMGNDVFLAHVQSEQGDTAKMKEVWGDRFVSIPYTRPQSRGAEIRRRLLRPFNPEARYLYSLDEWYDKSIDPVLKQLQEKHRFDTVIVEYVFFSRALECFDGDVLKIIDTHDAFANRHRHYLAKGQTPKWYSTTPREEGRGFDRADIVVAIQDKEREQFARQTKARVITVGHMVPLHQATGKTAPRILFVASDNHINVSGIEHFIENTFPLVRKEIPDAELILAGSVCTAVADREGVVKLGRVDDLQPVYESASVVINPVLFNTGLSIKNLEALGYSRPLVTASVGAEGIEDGANQAFLVEDAPERFARAVIRIISDKEFAMDLSRAAGRYAADRNRAITKQLERVLESKQNRNE